MALTTCPECSRSVSDAAAACPHCGYPMAGSALAGASVRSAPPPKQLPPTQPTPAAPSSFSGRIPSEVRRLPPRTVKIAGVGAVAIMGVFIWSLVGTSQGNEPGPPPATAPGNAADQLRMKPVATTFAASALASLYMENEVRADQMVRGKWIGVEGRVGAVQKDIEDRAQIIFAGGPVARLRSEEEARAAALPAGITVEVHCEMRGMTLGTPFLDECVFAPRSGFSPNE